MLPVVFIWARNFITNPEGRTQIDLCEDKVLRRIFGPKKSEIIG
jgi:hypothetical protein